MKKENQIARKTTFVRELTEGNSEPYLFMEETFNKDGWKQSLRTFGPSEDTVREVTYEYADGHLAKEIQKNFAQNTTLEKFYHRENGKLVKVETKGGEGTEVRYVYDDKGAYDEYTEKGGTVQVQRHFDDKGKLMWQVYTTNGHRTDFVYDDNGNVVEMKEEHNEGHTTIRHKNEYNADGQLSKVSINGHLSSEFFYGNDLLEKEIQYSPDGTPVMEMTCKYEFH
ncbi:MAG: hypothetical protein KDD36_12840 [Flavobacteriales bacterium]|nr:hypothetical protein [Flavobacteriales bacterium]